MITLSSLNFALADALGCVWTSAQPPRPHPVLHLDILSSVLPFLASSPSTLATICLLSKAIHTSATRQLYLSITLSGSPRTYQLFFDAHGDSPRNGVVSPCSYTKRLFLGRHFLPRKASSSAAVKEKTVSSLYTPQSTSDEGGYQWSDLHLPPVPSSLFPNLETLHLDVYRTHLASILPILITLNPVHLVISPFWPPLDSSNPRPDLTHPRPPTETASAYLPHSAFSGFTRLRTATILSTDLHPPSLSDYPPYSAWPFPLDLPALEKVEWVYEAHELERGFGRGFWQNLVGLFESEGKMEVGLTILAGKGEWGRGEDGPEAKAYANVLRSLNEAARGARLDLVSEQLGRVEMGELWSVGEKVTVRLMVKEAD